MALPGDAESGLPRDVLSFQNGLGVIRGWGLGKILARSGITETVESGSSSVTDLGPIST